MAITPTTWNPADKGSQVALSNGNLTASYSIYYQNRVRAVFGVSSGKWYWELTLVSVDNDAHPCIGAIDAATYITDSSQGPGELYLGSSGYAAGDVFGVAFDVDAGTLAITRNGTALVSTTGLSISGSWHPVCGGYDYGTLGDTTAWTANFGATAFAHTVPSGFTSGIGPLSHGVTGTCTTMYGTPTIDYPPIIKGVQVTKYGIHSVRQTFPVASLLPTSRVGVPHLTFDQTVQVEGTCGTQYGRPRLQIALPAPNQICSVTGTCTTQYGTPKATGAVVLQVTGTCTTQYGTPVSGRGYGTTGTCGTQYGLHGLSLGLSVTGSRTTKVGTPILRMGLPVVGTCGTRYGTPVARVESFHQVAGTCATHYGTPKIGARTVLVQSLPPVTRYGTPKLQAQPC